MTRANRYTGAVIFLFALYYLYEASKLPMFTPVGPHAGALPVAVGVALAILAAMLFVQNRPGKPEEGGAPDFTKWRLAAMVLAGLFVTVLLAKLLGHLLVIFLYMAFHTMVVARISWKKAVPASVGAALAFYLIFEVWLGVPMIVGVLGI